MNDRSSDLTGAVLAIALLAIVLCVAGLGGYRFLQSQRADRLAMERARVAEMEARDMAMQAQARAMQAHEELTRQAEETGEGDLASLRIVAWNVESSGNDPVVIAAQLVSLGHCDILGLTEVAPSNSLRYLYALQTTGIPYKAITTETGGSDRMMMVYDSSRLEVQEHAEMEEHEGVRMNTEDLRYRSPLMAQFLDKQSEKEFIVVLNHLARGKAEIRQEQAKGLRMWAEDQELPVIGIGDYNFDYDFPTAKGNAAFDVFLQDDVWEWVEPHELVDTNWADRDEDGVDDYPHSCLDFMFVAGDVGAWKVESRVIVRDGDFPDDDSTSDHRPVELLIER